MKTAIIVILAVALAGGFLYFSGGWSELGLITGSACQNIYGYYPSFRCCDEILDWSGSKTLSYTLFTFDNSQTFQCERTMSHCEVLLSDANLLSGSKVYVGSADCSQEGLFSETFSCTNDKEIPIGSWVDVPGGSWVHLVGQNNVKIDFKKYRNKLCECSLSPCGTPCPGVLGSDGCGFNTNDDVYDENGKIKVNADAQSQYAYTVPMGDCYAYYPDINRHIIGDTCEECEDNSDCKNRYPITYNYLGTEYGATCGGGYVQLYSCQATGSEVCTAYREDTSGNTQDCMEYGKSTRCDIYRAIEVQCCPGDSSCGVNSFCNPDTYTCKVTAQCTYDQDCGVTVMCDFTTNTLKTPVCSSGTCGFDTQNVGCCDDSNCASGYYCSADYTCREKTDVKQVCPYQCCEDIDQYFDRSCAIGNICCDDNTCKVSCEGVTPPPTDALSYWWLMPLFALIGGLIGFFWRGTAGGVILAIIGLMIAVLIVFYLIPFILTIVADITSNIWWI